LTEEPDGLDAFEPEQAEEPRRAREAGIRRAAAQPVASALTSEAAAPRAAAGIRRDWSDTELRAPRFELRSPARVDDQGFDWKALARRTALAAVVLATAVIGLLVLERSVVPVPPAVAVRNPLADRSPAGSLTVAQPPVEAGAPPVAAELPASAPIQEQSAPAPRPPLRVAARPEGEGRRAAAVPSRPAPGTAAPPSPSSITTAPHVVAPPLAPAPASAASAPAPPAFVSPAASGPAPEAPRVATAPPAAAVPAVPSPPVAPPMPATPPAPPPAAPAVAARPSAAAETSAIETVLSRYRTAFNALDATAARQVWPTVDARALGRAFDRLQEQEVTFDRCVIDVTGVQAEAACSGTARYVPRVGRRTLQVDARQWRFSLTKTAEGWSIAGVDAR
jgi:hypothetical protein